MVELFTALIIALFLSHALILTYRAGRGCDERRVSCEELRNFLDTLPCDATIYITIDRKRSDE